MRFNIIKYFMMASVFILACSQTEASDEPPEHIFLAGSNQDSWQQDPLTSCWISSPSEVSAYVKLHRLRDEALDYTCDHGETYSQLRGEFEVDTLHWLNANETIPAPTHIFAIQNTYQANAFPFSSLDKEALVTLRQASDGKWYVMKWLEVTSSSSSVDVNEDNREYDFPTLWSDLVTQVTAQQADFESLCGSPQARSQEDFENLLFQAQPGHCSVPEEPPMETDDGNDNN